MNYLFFLVHPSKFHVFRSSINILKEKGHNVDILITSKDVLEPLVKSEGWNYTNIFQEGRKIKNIHPYFGAIINTLRTIYRLIKFIGNKKYDKFITDDLLVIVGKLKGVPSFLFQDDDLEVVPETGLLMLFTDYILSPSCSDMGRFNYKKLNFNSYKELGALHPKRFTPNPKKIEECIDIKKRFFVIRLVSLKAVHDWGKRGLSDAELKIIARFLEKYGQVVICSERALPNYLEKYKINLAPQHMPHLLYYSSVFIGDSQTMCAESGVLGTPFIRYNDFVGKISYLSEIENKYMLGFGVKVGDTKKLVSLIKYLIEGDNVEELWTQRREKMLEEKVDLTDFLLSKLEDNKLTIK